MTEEELRFLRTLPEIEKDKRRDKGMSSLQQVLDVVDDLARHLLKEYPRIDIEDETAVIELCLDLGVDLRPKSGGQFAWADLVRAVHWNRHLQAFGGGACDGTVRFQTARIWQMLTDLNERTRQFVDDMVRQAVAA